MKNTLAENMLRFGVKNLSESTIKKLQEAEPTPPATTPGANPTPAKPTAPAKSQRIEQTFRVRLPKSGVGVGKIFANIPMVQGKAQAPSNIYIDWPNNTDGQIIKLTLKLSQGKYVFDMTMAPTVSKDAQTLGDEWAGSRAARILGPIKPLTALNNVIASINKQTGATTSIDSDVITALKGAESGVEKYATVQLSGSIGLRDGSIMPYKTASLTNTYDPETNALIKRFFKIGDIPVSIVDNKVTNISGLVGDMIKKYPDKMAGRDSSDIRPDVQAAYNAALAQIK